LHLFRFLIALSLLFLFACGGSGQRQEVRDKLVLVREQIRIMDAELAPTDDIGKQLLAQSSDNLKRVERLLIEDEIQQASTMLDTIAKRLAEHTRDMSDDQGESASFFTHFGVVSFSSDGVTYKDITEAQSTREIRSIKTNTRSGVKLNFAGAISLELGSNAQLDFVSNDSNSLEAVLIRGLLNANQSKAMPKLHVTLGGQKVSASQVPFSAEFSNQDLIKRRYFAVYVGEASAKDLSDQDQNVAAEQALWWGVAGPELIELVPRPVVDNPTPNETVGIQKETGKARVHFRWHANAPTPRFQLQVSEQPNFFTRIFDDQNLTGNGEFVILDPGLAYYRVRGVTEEGVPGPFTETQKLTVSANQLAAVDSGEYVPPVGPEVTDLQIEIIGETVIVTGKTNRETTKVSVNGIGAVMMDAGKFRAIVTFTRYGKQEVSVLALDPATGGETIVTREVMIGN
jgi:hypothetical protein